jgi:HK97 family phage prohead protease
MSIAGYAIVWGDVAQLETGREQFALGSLMNSSARLTFGHDPRPGAILGFARVVQDQHGACFRAQLDENRREVRQAIGAVRTGANFCSFKFRPLASRKSGDFVTIEHARLVEISIVGDPAYPQGGCWIEGDEPYLPSRLAALAEQFDRAPPLAATPAISAKPPRLAVGLDPVRAQVMGFIGALHGTLPGAVRPMRSSSGRIIDRAPGRSKVRPL